MSADLRYSELNLILQSGPNVDVHYKTETA